MYYSFVLLTTATVVDECIDYMCDDDAVAVDDDGNIAAEDDFVVDDKPQPY